MQAVGELEERLLQLAYHHPNDVRAAEILSAAGDRNLETYGLYLARDLPPEITVNLGFIGTRSSPLPRTSVLRAQRLFMDAITVLLRAESYGAEGLHELERKLVHTYYLELEHGDPLPHRIDAISALGAEAHERMLAYHVLNAGTVEDIARSLVERADWDLLFSRNAMALDRYREVYGMLAGHAEHQALLEELLAPDRPVVVPVFVPSPLDSDGMTEQQYVDVAFEISRYGKSRNIRVTGASSATAESNAREIVRLIARSRFRPQLRDGEPMRPSSVLVRYGL